MAKLSHQLGSDNFVMAFQKGITFAIALTLTSCAGIQKSSPVEVANTEDEIEKTPPPPNPKGLLQPGEASEKVDIYGVMVDPKRFDIPFRANNQVERWVEYFTDRGRGHFEVY